MRRNDRARLLIGRSVLAVHHVGKEQHDSEGYFGRFDDSTHAYFATPETDSATLDRFATDFDLTRQNDEPGLSLVIPWPEADITMTYAEPRTGAIIGVFKDGLALARSSGSAGLSSESSCCHRRWQARC